MATFADLKSNKKVRGVFEAYLKRKKLIGLYKFTMKKTKPEQEMKFLLSDITAAEDLELTFIGKNAKAIAARVKQEIAQDAGPKVISDHKRLELDEQWQKTRTEAKKRGLKAVDHLISSSGFRESKEYQAYMHDSVGSDLSRLSVDFAKEYDLDKDALALFAKRKEITDKMWQKALEKYAPKNDTKKKSKMPTFKDFKTFVKKKTGHQL